MRALPAPNAKCGAERRVLLPGPRSSVLGPLALVLLCACTLDPQSVIKKASLRVHVDGLVDGGATLTLTALDASGRQLVKKSNVTGRTEVEVLFEEGVVLDGDVELGAVLEGGDGKQLACGTAHGQTGAADPVPLTMTRANTDLNCGGCGVMCFGATHATRTCDSAAAACGALTCESGWFNVNGDPADGCETTCASPSAEDSIAACTDGLDNDCDGKTDCDDEGCQANFTRSCAFGACTGEEKWTCATNAWGTCGASASAESSPATCTDGLDNDCDGKTDCADEGCAGITQSCTVSTCSGVQAFVCSSGAFGACTIDDTLENTAAMCLDGLDNDCDGKTDCEEALCHDDSLESTIAACSDGIDNDCDGKVDCQDPGCLNIKQACSGTDICASGVRTWLCSVRLLSLCTVYVALPENNGLLCGDGLDNDCDGKTDCADSDCTGKGCALGKVCCPNGTCAKTCN
jgi:hypothetical protein